MLIFIASVTFAAAGLVGYLLAIVGSHGESKRTTLANTAPNSLSAYARRVMGVYVQRPPEPEQDEQDENYAVDRDLGAVGRR